jgi:hypothetical protein
MVGNVALRQVSEISHPIHHHPIMFRIPLFPLLQCTIRLFSQHVITTSVLGRSLTSVPKLVTRKPGQDYGFNRMYEYVQYVCMYVCMYVQVCMNVWIYVRMYKSNDFYGSRTRKLTTANIAVCNRTRPWTSSINIPPPQYILLILMLILSIHQIFGLPSAPFLSVSLQRDLYAFTVSQITATCSHGNIVCFFILDNLYISWLH